MKPDLVDFVEDILEAIEDIENFTRGFNFEDFSNDKKTVNAVLRSLEVIGEAVKKIPVNIREKNNDIPWKFMAGMRDKLIHEYFGIDIEIVWKAAKDELPPLKPKIKRILSELSS